MKRVLLMGILLIIMVGALNAHTVVSGYISKLIIRKEQGTTRGFPSDPAQPVYTIPCAQSLVTIRISTYLSSDTTRWTFPVTTDNNGFYSLDSSVVATFFQILDNIGTFNGTIAQIEVFHVHDGHIFEAEPIVINYHYTGNYQVDIIHD